jgi:hypothetical protein
MRGFGVTASGRNGRSRAVDVLLDHQERVGRGDPRLRVAADREDAARPEVERVGLEAHRLARRAQGVEPAIGERRPLLLVGERRLDRGPR